MLPRKATTLACVLLALLAFAYLTVVVAVLASPHLRYRLMGSVWFGLLAVLTALVAWQLWLRRRWAYRATVGISGLSLVTCLAGFSHHQASLTGVLLSLALLTALGAAYPEFRGPAKPLYLTSTDR